MSKKIIQLISKLKFSVRVIVDSITVIRLILLFALGSLLIAPSNVLAGVCSTTYCHGNFANYTGYVNPVSSNPATGKCGTCHRAGKFYDPAARNTTNSTIPNLSTAPAGGSHYQHTSTTTYNYSCKLCHNATLTNWKGNYTVPLSTSLHVNRATNIQFSTYVLTRPQIAVGVSSPTYFGFDAWNLIYSTQPPDTSYGACKNLYCHGNFAGSGYKTNVATWGRVSDGDCGTCHAVAKYAANKTIVSQSTAPAGGSHWQHVSTTTYNYDCRYCHKETVDFDGKISSRPLHVDYATEIRFTSHSLAIGVAFSTPIYSGRNAYDTFYSTSPPDTTYGKCENIYCHGAITPQYLVTRATPTWGNPVEGKCGTCHGAWQGDVSVATAPAGWKHTTHTSSAPVSGNYDYECRFCHENTVTWAGTIAFATWTHVQGLVDIKFSTDIKAYGGLYSTGTSWTDYYFGSPTSAVAGSYLNRGCKNLYCHSAGTRLWISTTTVPTGTQATNYEAVYSTNAVTCSSCHDFLVSGSTVGPTYTLNSSTGGKPNAHPSHTGYDCIDCHNWTVNADYTIRFSTHHLDAVYTATPSASYSFNYVFRSTPAASTCENISCHGGNYALWSGTVPVSCLGCHGATEDKDDYSPTNNMTALISTSSTYGWYASTHQYINSSCTNTYCHSPASTHRDTNNPFRLAVPSFSTGTEFGCLSGGAGCHLPSAYVRHSSYTTGGNNWDDVATATNTYKCIDCHDPHKDKNFFVSPSTGIAQLLQSLIARQSSDGYGRPYYTGLSTTPINFVSTSAVKATDFVTNFGTTTKICQTCHQANKYYTISWGSTTQHYAGSGQGACTASCHKHNTGFKPAGCSGCHGDQLNAYWPVGTLGDGYPKRAGSHQKHIDIIRYRTGFSTNTEAQTTICEFCHDESPMGKSGHDDNLPPADLNNVPNISTAPFYNVIRATDVAPYGYINHTTSKCINVDCHADVETPNWYSPPAVSSCSYCHNPGTNWSIFMATSNAHVTHSTPSYTSAGSTYTYDYNCTECHPDNALKYDTDAKISSYAHTNGIVEMWWSSGTVNFSTSAWYDKNRNATKDLGDSTFTYRTGGSAPCYNVYCHRPSSWTAINWNENWTSKGWSGIARCDECHGLPPSFSDTIKSSFTHYGDHTLGSTGTVNASTWVFTAGQQAGEIGGYNFGCGKCHPDPTIDASKHAKGMALGTSSMTANITFDTTTLPSNRNVTWSTGTIARQDSRGYWFTNTRCSSTFCHGTTLPSGMRTTGVYIATPTWNTNLAEGGDSACGACHARRNATSGSHEKHVSVSVSSYGYSCELCHYDSAQSTWTVRRSSHHVDGKPSWNLGNETKPLLIWSTSQYKGANIGSTGTFASYGQGVSISSCSNLYCHSKGQKDYKPPNRAPWWGGSIGTDCYGCHGSSVNYTVLTATHVIHVSTNTSKREYDYTCETCHKDTVTGKTTIKNYTLHVSSIANVSFATSTAVGYNRTFDKNAWARYVVWTSSGTCWDTYCHSEGTSKKTGLRPSSTIYWGR